jgi:hypothetical protein
MERISRVREQTAAMKLANKSVRARASIIPQVMFTDFSL